MLLKFLALFIIILANNGLAQANYEIIKEPTENGNKMWILQDNEIIHEITPEHQEEIGYESRVIPLYSWLIGRGSLDKQPKPFDDVTGDGHPNYLVLERPTVLGNYGTHPMVIRTFSIEEDRVREFRPYVGSIGEIIYFDDFNKNGVPELVLTDSERYFLYSKSGMPISRHVLIFDSHRKRYWRATHMIE